jgi:hypothetical protein
MDSIQSALEDRESGGINGNPCLRSARWSARSTTDRGSGLTSCPPLRRGAPDRMVHGDGGEGGSRGPPVPHVSAGFAPDDLAGKGPMSDADLREVHAAPRGSVHSNLGATPLARDRGKRVVDGGMAAVYHTLSPNHESAPPEMECTRWHFELVSPCVRIGG